MTTPAPPVEPTPTVKEIWQYPVKSMMGQRIERGSLTPLGLAGDRTWAARDEVRGGIRGAKKIGPLMALGAAYEDGPGSPVRITLPNGATTSTADADCNQLVSEAVDHEVTLQALAPADDLEFYRRGAPDSDDMMAELMAIFGRDDGEPLPDFSVFPPEIVEFESPPGTFFDVYPALVMTTSALRSMEAALPTSTIDVRRFRPTLLVDTGDATGHPEFEWVGRRLSVGDAELEIVAPCPRCVMVTRSIDADTEADRSILRHIVRDLDQNVGVYANVVAPGSFQVGDPVELG